MPFIKVTVESKMIQVLVRTFLLHRLKHHRQITHKGNTATPPERAEPHPRSHLISNSV